MPDPRPSPTPGRTQTVHIDVCPECGEATTYHPLDPPMACTHDRERYVPVEFSPLPAGGLSEEDIGTALISAMDDGMGPYVEFTDAWRELSGDEQAAKAFEWFRLVSAPNQEGEQG